jgi:hypothetical protein
MFEPEFVHARTGKGIAPASRPKEEIGAWRGDADLAWRQAEA